MIEEEMLKAWLKTSSDIKENRLLKEFTFNEMIVLNAVNNYKEISFKELRKKTNMLKSLLNRTINSLLKKDLLIIKNNNEDKRLKIISLNDKNINEYYKEHERMLKIMALIKNNLGEEDTNKLIELLNKVSDLVANVEND